MHIFVEHKIVTAGMFACLALSIFLKIFLGMLYSHMIKETDNMAITDNKLLKQCKTKFSNCYELNNGISNIPVFVDKFINRLSLGFLSFEMLYHLSGQLMLLSVVFSGIGICRSILEGSTLGEILPFYIVSFMGLYFYFSVSTVVDIKRKKRILRINLVDYLENHLSPRIHVTKQDMERLYGAGAAAERAPQSSRGRGGREEGRRKAAASGKRTVELMPIGNLQQRTGGIPADYGEEAEPFFEEKVSKEDRERTGQSPKERNSAEDRERTGPLPEEKNSADYREKTGLPFDRKTQEEYRKEAGDFPNEKSPADTDNSSAVTEEELEALLREFLTG